MNTFDSLGICAVMPDPNWIIVGAAAMLRVERLIGNCARKDGAADTKF